MNDLLSSMSQILGSALVLYFQTQGFHWNAQGEDFYQAHKLFGDQYNEQWAALDDIAERIRALDEVAPQSIDTLMKLSSINSFEFDSSMKFKDMCAILMEGHDILISLYDDALAQATTDGENGLANFIGGRIEAHQKHRWMLRASMK